MAFSVGNGTRVRFLKNSWYGDDPLCVSFPSLFAIALEKEAWVEDVWNHSERGVWAPRQLNDWEVVVVEHFFQRCKEIGCVGRWMIMWFGQSQKMLNFLSNLSTRLWNWKDKVISLQRWVSLLGRLPGIRS